jgi:hypothetical protein
LTAAAPDPAAFDALLKESVVALLADDRLVGFRHHILFDYAASRLFVDPLDINATADRLRTDRGLSLMLAPALAFALQSLWVAGGAGRPEFWQAAVLFAGDAGSDPVARSVAARMACELSETPEDMDGLVALLDSGVHRDRALKAFSHMVGALTVRVDDGLPVQDAPWCYLAAQASRHMNGVAWPLRTLLSCFTKRTTDVGARAHLGEAARALLQFAFDAPSAAPLVPLAIELVADTYLSNALESRTLLASTMTLARLATHAHEDIPALTRQAKTLLAVDPEFLVEIFGAVFGHRVTDTSATFMGRSQILPLTSNKKQDYDLSKWQLKEIVPRFLETHPEEAVRAIAAALEGHIRLKYGASLKEQAFTVGSSTITLLTDQSYIWASDPEDRHAHADNIASIILAFKKRLETAGDVEAQELARYTICHCKLAVLWARMFLVGAGRPETLGRLLWPYASATQFLRAPDTEKDAIDLVAAMYPFINAGERLQFEEQAWAMSFPNATDPVALRLRFLGILFGAIGAPQLVTEDARTIIHDAAAKAISTENHRPHRVTLEWGTVEPYYWLTDEGIDINAPANAALLRLIEAVDG